MIKNQALPLFLATVALVVPASAASLSNPTSVLWNSGGVVDIPGTGSYTFPTSDGSTLIREATTDYQFSTDTTSTWRVENNTLVNITVTSGCNRFFIGTAGTGNGNWGALTITANSNAGTIYLGGTAQNYGFRIGHTNGYSAAGTLTIDGGVALQSVQNIWGQGNAGANINVLNGSLSFMRDMSSQTGSGGTGGNAILHDTTVMLGMNGELFLAGFNFSTDAAFDTFLTSNGKNILMDSSLGSEYSLVYQNGISLSDAVSGANVSGVRISVIPEPCSSAFAGIAAAGMALLVIRRRRNKGA